MNEHYPEIRQDLDDYFYKGLLSPRLKDYINEDLIARGVDKELLDMVEE